MGDLALPDPEDRPAVGAQLSGHPTVSTTVCLDLLAPECGVVLRGPVALWAPMPKAAIDEDGHPFLGPGEVGSAGQRQVAAPALEAKEAEGGREAELGGAVTSRSNRSHVARSSRRLRCGPQESDRAASSSHAVNCTADPFDGGRVADQEVHQVADHFRDMVAASSQTPESFWNTLIRKGIDEVIDGPRTGRWRFEELEKTEKTYIGTKMEILVRSEFELERGRRTDLLVRGHEVDVKWAVAGNWMIARENVGEICLGLQASRRMSTFSVGLFRAEEGLLTAGSNQDKKRQLTAAAKASAVEWLVHAAPLTPGFFSILPPDTVSRIFGGSTAQERVRLLAQLVPRVPLSREVIATVAGNMKDPMRRLRRDKYRDNPLGDMVLLHASRRRELSALGIAPLPRHHWIAVAAADLSEVQDDPVSS